MLYAYQLRGHSNARYQESLVSLSQKELACMLEACGVPANDIKQRTMGGAPFLCFEAPMLSPGQQAFLCGHSGLYMTAALEGGLLRPLERPIGFALPQDMPEILKYKGKTNAAFTQLMINLALAAGGQWQTVHPRVLDPICGHGTTLFCALSRGMDAVGIDSDRKALQEGTVFAQKWLQYHRIKHTTERSSLTLPQGKNAPCTQIAISPSPEDSIRKLTFLCADTRDTGALLRRHPVHALVADLPYGVQHAPRENGRMSDLETLLAECLPAWRQAVLPGCAAALSFNTYTLRRERLARIAQGAGWRVFDHPLYADFSHWVEQAVNRDVLVLLQPDQ